MTQTTLDAVKSEAFAGQMMGMLNQAALGLMSSIGHQLGLFDVMARLAPATSQQIADAAVLNERYVREWLGSMVTGRIIEHDPSALTYTLRPEHAAWLTRAAGTNNVAQFASFIPLLANVESGIIESFQAGGGVSYASFPRFSQLMAENSAAVHDEQLIEGILPLVTGLIERLQAGIDVLDVGCGRGHAINLMARAFPRSRFLGCDFSVEGITAGRSEAELWNLSNARFEVRDVTSLEMPDRFDLVTAFDSIHDQAQPSKVMHEISLALRPDGAFLMMDVAASSTLSENIDLPLGPFMYAFSCMHCMTVSLALGGEGLGAMWGEQTARRMLAEAGFSHVEVKPIPNDPSDYCYVATKG